MSITATHPQSISIATPSGRGLRVALWVAQSVTAALFAMAGSMKSTLPIAELATKLPWTASAPEALVRFIGVAELAGAVGLLLPALTRIKPGLTALAGAALTLVMILAAGFHVSRSEFGALPINLVLGSLAAFVAWGRFRAAPIAPR
jgi:hypothetical protein